MCNLYSNTTNLDSIRFMFDVGYVDSSAGNLPAQNSIFPAYDAPVIRLRGDGKRELTMMHWGFIMPQKGKAPKVVNNTRDDKALSSFFWKWSFIERRCLVPASSFAEYHPAEKNEKGHKAIAWFALKGDELRPPFSFAGIWRTWKGDYKAEHRELETFSILTTRPNDVVKPVHPTRMPVIIPRGDQETWLKAPPEEAIKLAKPYAPDLMHIVKIGDNRDEGR